MSVAVPASVLHRLKPALCLSPSCSLCHPRGGHQQPEEAGGEVREGVGPCHDHPQGLGHVWGSQLPAPHDHTLLYQCEHSRLGTCLGSRCTWERADGGSSGETPGLGAGKRWAPGLQDESLGNCWPEVARALPPPPSRPRGGNPRTRETWPTEAVIAKSLLVPFISHERACVFIYGRRGKCAGSRNGPSFEF